MSSEPKIRLDGVGKTYHGSPVAAVEELTLDVHEGEILVLVGPSGCGKSTTLRLINRMIEPSSGRILLDGEDVTTVNPDQLRRRIGYVIQQIGLFPHQTIAQNIATVPKMLGWDSARTTERVDYLLEMVGLDPALYRDRYPKELSGGQAQRVGVARALGADPDIMLMDEPFGAIDPITRERLQNEFLRLQAELHKTIVFVTHDIDEAIKMGDRIAILGDRSVIRQLDTPERILAFPVDDFVNDFIGTGSTIKGLNFEHVRDVKSVTWPHVTEGDDPTAALAAADALGLTWILLLDADDRPTHWVSVEEARSGSGSLAERGVEVVARVHPDDSLFEALEQMVQSAVGVCSVVDEDGRYLGTIRMAHINKVIRNAQLEAQVHYAEMEDAS